MVRKVTMLALAVAAAAAAGGCRSRCGGWFTSGSRAEAPCQLAGSGPVVIDGVPAGGGFSGGVPGGVVPGGSFVPGGAPSELPVPQPSDLIPRPGVPFAPPSPAPGESGASVLPAPKGGVPVGR